MIKKTLELPQKKLFVYTRHKELEHSKLVYRPLFPSTVGRARKSIEEKLGETAFTTK